MLRRLFKAISLGRSIQFQGKLLTLVSSRRKAHNPFAEETHPAPAMITSAPNNIIYGPASSHVNGGNPEPVSPPEEDPIITTSPPEERSDALRSLNERIPPEILENIFNHLAQLYPEENHKPNLAASGIRKAAAVCRVWHAEAWRLPVIGLAITISSNKELLKLNEWLSTCPYERISCLTCLVEDIADQVDLRHLPGVLQKAPFRWLRRLTIRATPSNGFNHFLHPSHPFLDEDLQMPAFPPSLRLPVETLELECVHPQVSATVLLACDPDKLKNLVIGSLLLPGPNSSVAAFPQAVSQRTFPVLDAMEVTECNPATDPTLHTLCRGAPKLEKLDFSVRADDCSGAIEWLTAGAPPSLWRLIVRVGFGTAWKWTDRGQRDADNLLTLAKTRGWKANMFARDPRMTWTIRLVSDLVK